MEEYGDFAMAVVAAHEVGDYAQDQLRLLEGSYPYGNFELRADCFAGLWGYSVYENVEEGNIGEAMNIAWAGGNLPGTELTEPGAHGASEHRVRRLLTGYDSGDAGQRLSLTPPSEGTTLEETTG
jgi:predicted metalloprotease